MQDAKIGVEGILKPHKGYLQATMTTLMGIVLLMDEEICIFD